MNKKGNIGDFIKDHKFFVLDQFLKNYDLSLISLFKIVGKHEDGLIELIQKILTKALKSFITSNLLVDETQIGNALKTAILYT